MFSDCIPNWSELAAAWDAFEQRGVTPGVLDFVDADFGLPVVVMGCGRGLLVKALEAKVGHGQVVGFDTSAEMICAARARGVSVVRYIEDGSSVPELDHQVGAIIVATGVIDGFDEDELRRFLASGMERLRLRGRLVVCFFATTGMFAAYAKQIGADVPLGFRWAPVIAGLLCERDEKHAAASVAVRAWIERVAEVLGVTFEGASAWLLDNLPATRRLIDLEEMRAIIESIGLTIETVTLASDGDVGIICASRELDPGPR